VTEDLFDFAYRCCALADDHDGPCQWKCSDCGATGRCIACDGTGGNDDVDLCVACEGSGACPTSCQDGYKTEDVYFP